MDAKWFNSCICDFLTLSQVQIFNIMAELSKCSNWLISHASTTFQSEMFQESSATFWDIFNDRTLIVKKNKFQVHCCVLHYGMDEEKIDNGKILTSMSDWKSNKLIFCQLEPSRASIFHCLETFEKNGKHELEKFCKYFGKRIVNLLGHIGIKTRYPSRTWFAVEFLSAAFPRFHSRWEVDDIDRYHLISIESKLSELELIHLRSLSSVEKKLTNRKRELF